MKLLENFDFHKIVQGKKYQFVWLSSIYEDCFFWNKKLFYSLWGITENLNILYRENWTRLAADEIIKFQKAMFKVLRESDSSHTSTNTGTMTYYQSIHKWGFSSSFLYSLTLITTIGKFFFKLLLLFKQIHIGKNYTSMVYRYFYRFW